MTVYYRKVDRWNWLPTTNIARIRSSNTTPQQVGWGNSRVFRPTRSVLWFAPSVFWSPPAEFCPSSNCNPEKKRNCYIILRCTVLWMFYFFVCRRSFIFGPRKGAVLVPETGSGKQLDAAPVVFTLREAHGDGRPSHETHTDFVVQFGHVEFRFFATEHVVFGLFHNWCYAVELATVGVGFHDFHRWPSGRPPIHYPSLRYHIVHGSHHF